MRYDYYCCCFYQELVSHFCRIEYLERFWVASSGDKTSTVQLIVANLEDYIVYT